MKHTSKLSRLFKFVWLTQETPNMAWDSMLNVLIDKGVVTSITQYDITFNDKYTVWIKNHPYASGSITKNCFAVDSDLSTSSKEFHCTKKTKIRLEDLYFKLKPFDDVTTTIEKHKMSILNAGSESQ
jgi:hypothetical protein